MIQVLIGVVILLVGAGLAYAATLKGKRIELLKATPTIKTAEVAGLAGSMVEVTGRAVAGPQGALTSPLSNQACVWHRVRVTEHYTERDSNGSTSQQTNILSDISSDPAFGIQDDAGFLLVDPRNATADAIEKTTDNMNGQSGGNGLQFNIGGLNLGGNQNSQTEQEEWIIRVGTTLFISGVAGKGEHGGQISKPDSAELLISTRNEEQLQKAAAQGQMGYFAAAAVAVVVGLIVIATGL